MNIRAVEQNLQSFNMSKGTKTVCNQVSSIEPHFSYKKHG